MDSFFGDRWGPTYGGFDLFDEVRKRSLFADCMLEDFTKALRKGVRSIGFETFCLRAAFLSFQVHEVPHSIRSSFRRQDSYCPSTLRTPDILTLAMVVSLIDYGT